MPKLIPIEEVRGLCAHLDANLPGWREGMLANSGGDSIHVHLEFKDGDALDVVLYCRPEPVTVEFGGEEFGEFEPGA